MQHRQLWQPARRAYHHSRQTTALWDSNQHGNCHTQRRTHGRRVGTASKRWHMGPQQYGICGAQRHPSRYPQCTGAPELRASQHSRRNRQCGTAMASIHGAQRHPSGHPQCTKAPKRGRVSTAGAIGNVGPQQQVSAAHKAPRRGRVSTAGAIGNVGPQQQASAVHKAPRRGRVSTAGAIGNVGPQQQASAAHRGTQAGICGAQGTQAGIHSAQGTQAGASQHSRRNRHVGPQQQASAARTGTQAGIRSAQGTQAGASHHSRRNRCGTATAVASAVRMAASGGGISAWPAKVAIVGWRVATTTAVQFASGRGARCDRRGSSLLCLMLGPRFA